MREDTMIDTLFPPEGQTDQAATDPTDGTNTEKAQPEKADAPKTEESKPAADGEEKLSKLLKRLEDKDKHIGKQGDELGRLRKQMAKLTEALGIEGDPEEALKEKQERESEEREKATETYRTEVREWVSTKIPKFDELLPTMKEVLKDDAKYGITDEVIDSFASDPYKFPIDTLVGLSERAALRAENKKLREQLEALPKKLSRAVGTNTPKASPSVDKGDTEDVDIYGQLGIYRLNKS